MFYNHVSDVVATGGTPLTFINGRDADIFGGEIGFEAWITPWLSGFANYSYQDIRQGSSRLSSTLDERGGPQNKFNTGLRAEFDNGLNGEIAFHHVGSARYPINPFFRTAAGFSGGVPPPSNKVGSYNLLNLRGAYRFWDNRSEVAISVFNALNDKHREHPLGDIIRSRVMGWITIKL